MRSTFDWPTVPAALCAALLAAASCAATATEAIKETSAQSLQQAEAARQAEARAILMDMADYLAGIPSFSVDIQSGYDVLQASGQTVEFGEKRKVMMRRPDRLRIDIERSDGEQGYVLYDGQQITALIATQNRYAQASVPGGIDKAITYAVKDLKVRVPLALLLVSTMPAELERRVQSVDYVEMSRLFDVPCHHLVVRTDSVDFQIWISDDEQPLPRRVVLTYKNAEGQPQFWAQLSDWDLEPEITDATFAFTPPKDAESIPFLTQYRRIGSTPMTTTNPTGAQP